MSWELSQRREMKIGIKHALCLKKRCKLKCLTKAMRMLYKSEAGGEVNQSMVSSGVSKRVHST